MNFEYTPEQQRFREFRTWLAKHKGMTAFLVPLSTKGITVCWCCSRATATIGQVKSLVAVARRKHHDGGTA